MNVINAFKHYEYARLAAARFGFRDPLFLMAQVAAENSFSSKLLSATNNVGSLTSRNGEGKKHTSNEFWQGEDYQSKSSGLWFRKYSSLLDGWLDYARLLGNVYKLNTARTIEEYASKISASAYIDERNGDNREQYKQNIISSYNVLKGLRFAGDAGGVVAAIAVLVLICIGLWD